MALKSSLVYNPQLERGPIITIVGERGGELYEFVNKELSWITSTGVQQNVTSEIPFETIPEPSDELDSGEES